MSVIFFLVSLYQTFLFFLSLSVQSNFFFKMLLFSQCKSISIKNRINSQKYNFYIGNTNPLGRYCVSHKANTWNLYWAVSFYYFMRFTNCIIITNIRFFFLVFLFSIHSPTVFLVTNYIFFVFQYNKFTLKYEYNIQQCVILLAHLILGNCGTTNNRIWSQLQRWIQRIFNRQCQCTQW